MNTEVKKCADSNDIKGLHYIFVDCLDVDPTFEKYKDDYEYCKKITGFLENHVELTPFLSRGSWNKSYWDQLKIDLLKNFSERRFSHMREVAQVIYSDKIVRLKQERENEKKHQKAVMKVQQDIKQEEGIKQKNIKIETRKMSPKEEQDLAIEKKRQKLAEEEYQKAKQREEAKRQNAEILNNQYIHEDNTPKKSMGIVMAIVLIILVIVVVAILVKKLK